MLDLEHAGRTLIVDYSTRHAEKIGLASAPLAPAARAGLDEPFEAVDPVRRGAARLDGFRPRWGRLLSTHTMALVEQLCDHVAVMADGKVLRAGRGQVRRPDPGGAFAELVGAALAGAVAFMS